MNKLFCFLLCTSSFVHTFNPVKSLFDSLLNYQANKQYQKGDFAKAEHEYQELLADNPNNSEYNYNVGVSLYKQKKYEQAQEKFSQAIDNASVKSMIKEQSLFNRGNCSFEQAKFQDAINDYKKVLQINPDNKNAQNNLKLAEQKLQEQKKKEQEQRKKEQEQKKQQDQQQKEKENKEDCKNCQNQNDSQGSDKDQEQDKKNQQDSKQSKDSKNQKSNQSKKENKPEESEQDVDQKSGDNQKQGSNKQDRQQNEEQSKQQQGKQSPEEQLKKAEKEKAGQAAKEEKTEQQKTQHDQSLEKKEQQHSKASQAKEQKEMQQAKNQQPLTDEFASEMMPNLKQDERLTKQNAMLLEKLDEYEKNIQKKLLQLNVSKQGASKYGQKNW